MKTTVLKILLPLLWLAISSGPLLANKGDNFLNKGNTQYLKGNLDDAMKLYTRADKSCIEEKDKIENNKALVLAQKGRYESAVERLTNALEINPNNANAYYNRGIIQIQSSNYNDAIDDLENAKYLGLASDQSLSYNLALSYYLDNQLAAAALQLDMSVTKDHKVDYLKGLIAYQQKEFDKAAVAFSNSIAKKDHPDVRFANALSQYYAGNIEQGLTSLDKLKKEKSLRDKVQLIYANLAYEGQDFERAQEAYESIIKNEKNNADANARLGAMALAQSIYSLAEKHYDVALKTNPSNELALEGLGHIEFINEEYEKSVETFDRLLVQNPTNQKALYGKALSAMHRPDPYTCLDALEKINKKNLTPEQIEKVVLLEARALGICNKKEEAVKLLRKYRTYALDKKKIKVLLAYFNLRMFRYSTAVSNIGISKFDDFLPYLLAGHASLHQSKFSSAYRYYRKAYAINNKHPDVLMGAAICMIELDMEKQAVKVIDSLEVLYPDNYYVHNSKGIIYKDLGLELKKKGNLNQAKKYLETAESAFKQAKAIRPPMAPSFDNNIGLTYFYRDQLDKAKSLFDESNRLASKNNRALMDVSTRNYTSAIRQLDSLNRDFMRKNNDVPNSKVKKNLELANKQTPMANNYKFITYYFLHQDKPPIDRINPFNSQTKTLDLSSDLQPELDYILEYSEAECEDTKKERKKKKRKKIKIKLLKKKKSSTKCPTFKA